MFRNALIFCNLLIFNLLFTNAAYAQVSDNTRNLSETTSNSVTPIIAKSDDITYVVWNEGGYQVSFQKLVNGEPIGIVKDLNKRGNPYIKDVAMTASGQYVYVTWTDNFSYLDDCCAGRVVYFTYSKDYGNTFAEPFKLNEGNDSDFVSSYSFGPRMSSSGSHVGIIWSQTEGIFAQSISILDLPITPYIPHFKKLSSLSNVEKIVDPEQMDIAVTDTNVYAAWKQNDKLMFARSKNNGTSYDPVDFIATYSPGESHSIEIEAVNNSMYLLWGNNGTIYLTSSHNSADEFGTQAINDVVTKCNSTCFSLAPNASPSAKMDDEVWAFWDSDKDTYAKTFTKLETTSATIHYPDVPLGPSFIDVYGDAITVTRAITLPGELKSDILLSESHDAGTTWHNVNFSGTTFFSIWPKPATHESFYDVAWMEHLNDSAFEIYYKKGTNLDADLHIDSIEAVQTTLNQNHLVKGKATVIKAVINNGFISQRAVPIKIMIDDGFNRQEKIYDVLLKTGSNTVWLPNNDFIRPEGPKLGIEIDVDPENKIQETNENNNYKNNEESLQDVIDTKGLNLLVVPIDVKNDTATSSGICNAEIVKVYSESYIDALFPVDDRETNWDTLCASPLVLEPTPITDATELFKKIYSKLMYGTWTGNYSKIIGTVREGWFKDFYKGPHSEKNLIGLSPSRSNVNNITGSVLVEAKEQKSGQVTAHELIHNFGFPGTIDGHQNNVLSSGFWVNPRKGVQQGLDIMNSSVDPKMWIANNTFDYLLDKLTKRGDDPAVIGILGMIGKDDSVDIDSWYIFDSILDVQLDASGEFTLEYQNATGDLLAKTGFDANYTQALASGEGTLTSEKGFFSVRVPVVPEMEKLVIKRGNTVLFTRNRSEHTPFISIQNPRDGDVYHVGDTVTVNWEGNDEDGDNLHYIVTISKDNGSTWIPLAADITENTLTFKATKELVTTEGKLRVFATDGLNTTITQSNGTFSITPKVNNGKIAYTATANEPGKSWFVGKVWTINPDGTDNRDILSHDEYHISKETGYAKDTNWSPDGKKITFQAQYWFTDVEQSKTGIWTANADGSGLVNLYQQFDMVNNTAELNNTSCPAWSPDGKKIRFIAQSVITFTYDIWEINSDGTNLNKRYDWPDDFEAWQMEDCPSWSPDGSKITYATGQFSAIYVSNPDLTERVRLTPDTTDEVSPSWSPNGSKIAFLRADRTNALSTYLEIWVMNIDGTNRVQLTNYPLSTQVVHNASDLEPIWSPDSAQIAYLHKNVNSFSDYELWTMDWTGENKQQITSNNPIDGELSWQKIQTADDKPLISSTVTANAGGPYMASEGAQITLDASNSTASAQIASYKWDLDNDGDFDDATGAQAQITINDDGEYFVAVQVTDTHGVSDVAHASIKVQNAAPQIDQLIAQIDTTQKAEVRIAFTDPGTQDTHTAMIDWGDGQPNQPASLIVASGSAFFVATHKYNAAGNYSFNATIADDDHAQIITSSTFTQKLINHAPVVTNVSKTTNVKTPIDIDLPVTDQDEETPATFRLVNQPTNGNVFFDITTITKNNIPVTYIPKNGFTGTDTFSYKVSDGKVDSNTGEVTITVVDKTQPLVCANAKANPTSLWPANHAFTSIDIIGIGSGSATITKKIMTIKQDEALNDDGDGNTTPDGKGVDTNKAEVRAERSGNKNGRVYTIGFSAWDDKGATCSGIVKVGVPHNKKDQAVDDGALYNSIGQ